MPTSTDLQLLLERIQLRLDESFVGIGSEVADLPPEDLAELLNQFRLSEAAAIISMLPLARCIEGVFHSAADWDRRQCRSANGDDCDSQSGVRRSGCETCVASGGTRGDDRRPRRDTRGADRLCPSSFLACPAAASSNSCGNDVRDLRLVDDRWIVDTDSGSTIRRRPRSSLSAADHDSRRCHRAGYLLHHRQAHPWRLELILQSKLHLP